MGEGSKLNEKGGFDNDDNVFRNITIEELQEVSKLDKKVQESISCSGDDIICEEEKSSFIKVLSKIYIVIAVIWGTFHIYTTRHLVIDPTRHSDLHLIFAIILTTITFLIENKNNVFRKKVLLLVDLFFFIITMLGCLYIFKEYYNLSIVRQFAKTGTDHIMGLLVIIGVIYYTWRKWGLVIPVCSLLSILYFMFGNKFPVNSIFYFSGAKLTRLIEIMTVNFQGIFGSLLSTSATTVVMFVILGGVFVSMGALKMIMDIIYLLAGNSACGAAQLATIGSAAFGTISGASAANVAVTGSVTIPMMKKHGLDPSFAAAVESVASTGGGIMPPVMGAAAFLMASMANVTYWQVVKIATIPAVLFYFTILTCVLLRCRKLNLPKDKSMQKQKIKRILNILMNNLFIVIPFCSLIYFMSRNVAATMTALYAIIIAFLVRLLHFLIFEKTGVLKGLKRIWDDYINSMKETAEMMAPLAIIMAALGLFTEAITGTGIGNRISFVLIKLSNNSIFPLLLLMAIICMIFGCGLPTIPSYLLVALVGGPALATLGVPLILSHYFVLYYANLSQITPPVGITTLVASKIADTSYLKSGWAAIKLAIPIYLVPMILIYYNGLGGMQFANGYGEFFICLLAALYALIPLCIAVEGYFIKKVTILGRVFLLVPPAVVLSKNVKLICIGFIVMITVLAVNAFKKTRTEFRQEII